MLESRILLTASIGYILGIIMGLYCKISIVLFYVILFFIYLIFAVLKKEKKEFKLISVRRYFRYIKLIVTKKVIMIVIIFSVISNSIVIYQNKKYNTLYTNVNNQKIEIVGIICSNAKEDTYKRTYKLKVKKVNNMEKYRDTYLYISVNKKISNEFKYGDKVKIIGEYIEPNTARNYKGFNYKQYLKSKKIYGTVQVNSIIIEEKSNIDIKKDFSCTLLKLSNNMFLKYKNKIENNFDKDTASLLLGLTLGYTESIDNNIKQSFSESNISHILAISGMHVSYIASILIYIFNKLTGKRKSIIITNIFLGLYMSITGFSISVVRACIMYIIALSSNLLYRKNDTWNNIGMAILVILIYNPFLIQNLSMQLTFLGTIGILIFEKNISTILHKKIYELNYRKRHPIINEKGKLYKSIIKISNSISITLSACVAVNPIIAISFSTMPITSILVSIFISLIIASIVIISMIIVFIPINFIQRISSIIINPLIKLLINLAKLGSLMPLNKVYIKMPYVWQIILYYLIIIVINFIIKIYNKKKITSIERRFKNLLSLTKYNLRKNKGKVIICILIVCILSISIRIVPKDLKIYFVDVGQGDCTLVQTPQGKNILIDGGGSEIDSYDVGKNVLLPYLLARRIKRIDYIVISHFDTDHSLGCAKIIENIDVSSIILSEQFEENDIYKHIVSMAKQKNIRLIYVKAGNVINIDGVKLSILHPQKELMINNAMNNNSIVCKLEYQSFSMLFTGDIEQDAEELILNKNINLKADILKVAHHRI